MFFNLKWLNEVINWKVINVNIFENTKMLLSSAATCMLNPLPEK